MIVVTNRMETQQHASGRWSSEPDVSGRLHWMQVNDQGNHVESPITTDSDLECAKKWIRDVISKEKHLLIFVPGGRAFDIEDFTKFRGKMLERGFKGEVLGFSPPFEKISGEDIGDLICKKTTPDRWMEKQYERSFNSVESVSRFLRTARETHLGELSIICQSGGNDVIARTLNHLTPGSDAFPMFKHVISTASIVDERAFSGSVSQKPTIAKQDEPVLDANRLAYSSATSFTIYHREDDNVLRIAKKFLENLRPVGLNANNFPKDHLKKTSVSVVDCRKVAWPPKHKGYEKKDVIIDDLVDVLERDLQGDRTLPRR